MLEEEILVAGIIVHYVFATHGESMCGGGMRAFDEVKPVLKSVKEYLINRFWGGDKTSCGLWFICKG
ncbi:MAG: hypothetical protein KIH08_14825 [Candidatus Freyarchaeota archaeon]|nr:hypothetical protein [Candidatus Jordarchaeia archaeon]MBS7281535.1 hypothetical protein [Candidatus Jordarchaeia archaeon]